MTRRADWNAIPGEFVGKEELSKLSILEAALNIVEREGWGGLSMRKIAGMVQCSAPVIYRYFKNKNAIKSALSWLGYLRLTAAMNKAKQEQKDSLEQLIHMFLAYGQFARQEKILYQLMFEPGGADLMDVAEEGSMASLVTDVIRNLLKERKKDKDAVIGKYLTIWALVHGMSASCIKPERLPFKMFRAILMERIKATFSC